ADALLEVGLDAVQEQGRLAETPRVASLGQLALLAGEQLLELLHGRVVEASEGLGLAAEPVQLPDLLRARRLARAPQLDLEAGEVGEGARLEIGGRLLDPLGEADAADLRRL